MSSAFESINTGVAAHIGKYADAVRIPPGAEVIYTSGTPGLRPDGTVPEDFTEEATLAWRNVENALSRAGARFLSAALSAGALALGDSAFGC